MSQVLTQAGQPAAQALPAGVELPRPAAFDAATSQAATLDLALLAGQAAFASELDSAGELLADTTDSPVPGEDALVADVPLPMEHVAAEADAEQWLLSMLGQRATQVQARDGEQAVDEPQARMDAVEAMGLRAALDLPLSPGIQPDPAHAVAAKAAPAMANLSSLEVALSKAPPAALDGVLREALDTPAGSPPERLAGQLGAAPEAAGSATPASQPLSPAALAERTLKLQGPEHKWGEQMLHALREHVELQVQQRAQSATIRLDPPELGSMEIFLSHESGRLSVQISAAQADVARLLQGTSERLRQELLGQNFMQVSVGVSSDAQSGRQHGQQGRAQSFEAEAGVAANASEASARQSGSKRGDDVLITV